MEQPSGEPQSTTEGQGGSGQPPANQPQGGGQQGLDEPKFTQRDLNNMEARFKREYRERREADDALIELGRQAQEALDAKRPLEERVATLTSERDGAVKDQGDLKVENRRMWLAGQARLHPDLWDRVRGNTDDEINADIETLKKFAPADEQQQNGNQGGQQDRGPAPNPQQGHSSGNPNATGSIAAGRDLHARRHGKQSAND